MPWVSISSVSGAGQIDLSGTTDGVNKVIIAAPKTPQQSIDFIYFSLTNNDTAANTVSIYLFNNGSYSLLYSTLLYPGYQIKKIGDAFINIVNPDAGSLNELAITLPATGRVSGQTMVMLSGAGVIAFDPTVQSNAALLVGMSTNGAVIGDPVVIAVSGDIVTNPGWGLTPNGVYFADINGGITLTPPSSGVSVKIGKAIDPNNLLIELYEPININ